MTRTVTVGIIPAPERATDIIDCILNDLPDKFSKEINSEINWEVNSVTDPLTGAAESVHDILYNAAYIKRKNNWDFAICLTDLPIFYNKNIVAAEISYDYHVAQISIPTFGWPPMKMRINNTIVHLLTEMYEDYELEAQIMFNSRTTEKQSLHTRTYILKRQFPIMPIRRQENPEPSFHNNQKHSMEDCESTVRKRTEVTNEDSRQTNEANDNNIDVRYMVYPRINGRLRLITGMTFANNPMKIMSSFKNIIAIAFTTGAFALIFPTIWKLGQIFSVYRLTALMLVAIFGLVAWIIIAHNLWEYPSKRNHPKIRRLYNLATTSTLIIDVTTYYVMMFLLFLTASLIFIPSGYLESVIDNFDNDSLPVFVSYLRVAWAGASISIIVSAMGAGLENEDLVRNITYGYRQNKRYQEMDHHENS